MRSHSDIVSDYRAGRIVAGLDAVSEVAVQREADVATPVGAGDSDHGNEVEEHGRQSSSGVVSREMKAYSALGLNVDSEEAESIPTAAVGVEDGHSDDGGPTDDNEEEEEVVSRPLEHFVLSRSLAHPKICSSRWTVFLTDPDLVLDCHLR